MSDQNKPNKPKNNSNRGRDHKRIRQIMAMREADGLPQKPKGKYDGLSEIAARATGQRRDKE